MLNRYGSRFVFAIAGLCLLGHNLGCDRTTEPTHEASASRGVLKVLGAEYGNFAANHGDKPPANKEELVAFLETRKDRIRGLKNIDQLFTSPRDNQPLVIFYGAEMPPADESGYPVVAHEAVGESGILLATNTRGGVIEISQGEIPAYFGSTQ